MWILASTVRSDRSGRIRSDRSDRIRSDRSDLQAHTGLAPINRERAPINRESGFSYNVDIGDRQHRPLTRTRSAVESVTTLTNVVGASRMSVGPTGPDRTDQNQSLLNASSLVSHPAVVGSGSRGLDTEVSDGPEGPESSDTGSRDPIQGPDTGSRDPIYRVPGHNVLIYRILQDTRSR